MLYEILLVLSGTPSPLLDPIATSATDAGAQTRNGLHSRLSPAEQELLRSLAQDLGQRNRDIKTITSVISRSHPSVVCRAISTAIVQTHLAHFQRRILEVEKDIISQNASLVGAHSIVPLSAIGGQFSGWAQKLDWLLKLVLFMQDCTDVHQALREPSNSIPCTAADILRRLRNSLHTGYPDIEVMARDLVKAAECAWLKQLSAWVLYGRLPSNGATDFFVFQGNVDASSLMQSYVIKDDLIPPFVSEPTAQSILFMGKSLNHIRERRIASSDSVSTGHSPDLTLLLNHLSHLSSLETPLNPSSFSTAIGAIRLSLSRNALQKLLPMSKVLGVLFILRDFFLLANGEFAVALVTAAEDRLSSRGGVQRSKQSLAGDLASMTITDGEVAAVLARTWSSLASLQSLDDEDVTDRVEQARESMSLTIKSPAADVNEPREVADRTFNSSFDDLLLPTPTKLNLHLTSPLDLFLTQPNIDTYSNIHAYLLGIRRAHLRLSRLFLMSVLRRKISSKTGKISQNQPNGFGPYPPLRPAMDKGDRRMRTIWATIGFAMFFLAELGDHFHGEVIQNSWSSFYYWSMSGTKTGSRSTELDFPLGKGPKDISGQFRPASSRSGAESTVQLSHDPETLTQAHTSYLKYLVSALLFDERDFKSLLRRLMTSIDHLAALMGRLGTLRQSLSFEADEVNEGMSKNHNTEELSVLEALEASRLKVASGVQNLTEALRNINAARSSERRHQAPVAKMEQHSFDPWNGATIDRLLLKLDFSNVDSLALPPFYS